jgi:hypothetical protein
MIIKHPPGPPMTLGNIRELVIARFGRRLVLALTGSLANQPADQSDSLRSYICRYMCGGERWY